MRKAMDNIVYLSKFIYKHKPTIFIYVFICGIVQAINLCVNILGVKIIIDGLENQIDYSGILLSITAYVLIQLFCRMFITYAEVYTVKVFPKLSMEITKEIINKTTKIDYFNFDDAQYYDFYTRASSQAGNYVTRMVGSYLSIVSNAFSVLSILSVIVFSLDAEFIVLGVLNVIVSYIIMHIQNKWQFEFDMKITRVGRIADYFMGVFFTPVSAKEIRIFGSEKFFENKYHESQTDIIKQTINFKKRYVIPNYIQGLVSAGTTFTTIAVMSLRIINKTTGIGNLVATLNAVQSLTQQLLSLIGNVPSLSQQSLYIGNLRTVIDQTSRIECESSEDIVLDKTVSHSIEFINVCFSYPNSQKYILNNLSFKINRGEHIAIVGNNGVGKSTIVKLLLRLYDPQEGSILIDGRNIKLYSVKSLRDCFAVVFQDSQLYSMTVAENISFSIIQSAGERNALKSVLDRVSLWAKVSKYKDGTNTSLTRNFEESGEVLSGGEAQRLFVARAYYRDAGMTILDEPSSSLDPFAESKLLSALTRLSDNRTTIVISHRLLMCQQMDKIFFIENGRVVESGSHGELISKGGNYFSMFSVQSKYYSS
jgi:ATP-binding cassette subfamily B protein